ncbi:MAG: hypothetical protein OES32_09755 [Acidobacteriota bacterium]|nr:hypothetical protein [Acidobacteriota bacterium]
MSDAAMPWTRPLSGALCSEKELLAQLREAPNQPAALRHSLLAALVGAAVFGVALGSYGMSAAQMVVSAVKVPLLLLGTGALCFPAFYVFQAVKASEPMSFVQSAALQATALSTTAMIWAALSLPLFFLVSTTGHYTLTQFLALAVGAIGGVVGWHRLTNGYLRLSGGESGHRLRLPLFLYLLVFGCVGSQLAWVLRPFIGSPSLGFELFRNLEGNIFAHVLRMLGA